MMFEVGEKVVYPAYGVGKIEAIENKRLTGQTVQCYVLTIPEKDLKIVLPVLNAEKVGLRHIINAEDIEKVLDILSQEIHNAPLQGKKWYEVNQEKIRTGSLYKIAEVFKSLFCLSREKTLSSRENKMLHSTRELIVTEIAHAKQIRLAHAESLLARYCYRV